MLNTPPPSKPWEIQNNNNSEQSALDTSTNTHQSFPLNNTTFAANHQSPLYNQSSYHANYSNTNSYDGMFNNNSNYSNYGYPLSNGYSPYAATSTYNNAYTPLSNNFNDFNFPSQIFSPGNVLGEAEGKVKGLLSSFGNVFRTVAGLTQMLDSTFYAASSSMMALLATIDQLGRFKSEHVGKWISLLKTAINWLFSLLRLKGTIIGMPKESKNENRQSLSNTITRISKLMVIPTFIIFLFSYLSKIWIAKHCILAKSVGNFEATFENTISVKEGDDLIVVDEFQSSNNQKQNQDWILVKRLKDAREGYLPASFVKKVSSH